MYINMLEINHLIKKRQSNNKYIGLPFGSAVRYKREEMNMTLEEACAGICSLSYLSKLENNIIKPSQHFIDLFKKRFNIKDEYAYDCDEFKTHLEKIISAILLDENIHESILKTFEEREDYESVLVNFAYYVLNDEKQHIEHYYKKMTSSIISMPEEAFMTAMLLVNHILYDDMRYSEGIGLLNTIERLYPKHEKIKLLILKGKLRHAFKLNNYALIYQSYDVYKELLIQKQLFTQLKKIHMEKLVHESRYKSCDEIMEAMSQIETFDDCNKDFLKAKCYSYKGEHQKALEIAKLYKEESVEWMVLYAFSLEHLKLTDQIIEFIDAYHETDNPKLKVILKHLKHKYKSSHDEQINYIKRDILVFQGMTEDNEILNYLLRDCEQMLVKHQYYKDAVSLYRIFVKKINNLSFT